jgi:hypothetical protein
MHLKKALQIKTTVSNFGNATPPEEQFTEDEDALPNNGHDP